VNSKGKKYIRGGIPGTALYYQSSLRDAQPGQALQSSASVSPLAIIIMAFLVVGCIIFAMSSSTPKAAPPVAPVPQTVAPVAAPVAPKHVVKKLHQKHAVRRARATAAEPDEAPAAEAANH
jgi:hypothetical protein